MPIGAVRDAGEVAGVRGRGAGRGDCRRARAPDLPPGLYAGADRRVALNVIGPETVLAAGRLARADCRSRGWR